MATFVLIPGAGGTAWYWHLVVPLLKAAGHAAIAIDLPGDDPRVGINGYADRVIATMDEHADVALVAQSMGGFTAAVVCARAPTKVRHLIFVNAMIPAPGETAGDWWDNTGWEEARQAAAKRAGYATKFDLAIYFLHDVPDNVVADGAAHQREEAQIAFTEPADFQAWPDAPVHVVIGKDDRFFPAEFQLRLARERIAEARIWQIPGGHLVALSRPRELAQCLLSCVREEAGSSRGG